MFDFDILIQMLSEYGEKKILVKKVHGVILFIFLFSLSFLLLLRQMRRFFGSKKTKKATTPGEIPDLSKLSGSLSTRAEDLERKIAQAHQQALDSMRKAKSSRGGTSQTHRSAASRHMKRKKALEQQLKMIYNNVMSVENVAYATENVRTTIETVQMLQETANVLKSTVKTFDIDDIIEKQEEMADCMADISEMNEYMNMNFEMDFGANDYDVDEELNALEAEMLDDDLSGLSAIEPGASSTSYLEPEKPAQGQTSMAYYGLE
ncbi:hypothetical protein PCE1_003556 [Barthelona sp. PCE]